MVPLGVNFFQKKWEQPYTMEVRLLHRNAFRTKDKFKLAPILFIKARIEHIAFRRITEICDFYKKSFCGS